MIYVGIDVGGTGIQVGLVDESGKIMCKGGIVTRTDIPFDMQVKAMADCVLDTIDKGGYTLGDVKAIGAGVPGVTDPRTGNIAFCTNLGWVDVPFVQEFNKHIAKPVFVGNDATVAGLAESVAGVSAGSDSSVFITLGTGVGGGIIINGKVYSGSNFAGGELGHTVIVVDGRPCTCGRHGCWETYASATGLIKTTKEHMKDAPKDSPIWTIVDGDESKVNGRTAFDAMRAGDPVGKAVVDEYIKYLSVGLTDMINIFQPAILCIGGGICNEGETLLAPVRAFIDREQYAMNSTKKTKVCKAQLGNDAGIIGAALLGKQED